MEKLIELLGKVIQAIFSAKTFWLITVAVAIFALALLIVGANCQSGQESSALLGVCNLLEMTILMPCKSWVVLLSFASVALILAKVVIWVVGLLRDQFFA